MSPSSDSPLTNDGINKRKRKSILELRPSLNFSYSFYIQRMNLFITNDPCLLRFSGSLGTNITESFLSACGQTFSWPAPSLHPIWRSASSFTGGNIV